MDEFFSEAVGACTLNRLFGYEPKIARHLICIAGSARNVFKLTQNELRDLLGPGSKYLPQINKREFESSGKELERLIGNGYRFIHIGAREYPQMLLECEDAPIGLYIRSSTPTAELFNSRPMISVVGTRNISPYGQEYCTRLVQALGGGEIKPTIVSGLAIGVDITAHRTALSQGLPTIGVLPNGIEEIYPSRHYADANLICTHPGSALITDYPPHTAPVAITFLRRNRIIAGMSFATILIESKARGGGMITARLAFDYGREVYALPGRIDDICSEGCNMLIAQKMAESIATIPSFLTSIGLGRYSRKKQDSLSRELVAKFGQEMESSNFKKLLQIALTIKKNRGIDLEGLCRECNLEYCEVSELAGRLLSRGFIEMDLLQRCSIKIY